MKFRAAWALAAVLPVLSGCHTMREMTSESCHKPRPYMAARSVPPLTIPTGLSSPDTRDALVVPPLKGPTAPPPTAKDPCLDAPPSYIAARSKPAPTPAPKP